MEVAMLVKEALTQFDLKGFPKTSGATGMHIFVPVEPALTYTEVRDAVKFICRRIHAVYPEKTTMERAISKRSGKVYLDYLQNTRGKTMVFQYSLRPEPGAPVSAPVTWDEVAAQKIRPQDFNIKTIFRRLSEVGDLYREFHTLRQSLAGVFGLTGGRR
jgi:bifunctional non-homologous end joining protein LigD